MNLSSAAAASRRPKPAAVADTLALCAITFATAIPYLPRLGFYSDDWSILAGFESAGGLGAQVSLAMDVFAGRPVQGVYLALLFNAFGLHPLGYHIVNTGVLTVSAALFYWLLLRLHIRRAECFLTVLLFVMLPQLSTARVWYAAFQCLLSLALTLGSMHCQLSFSRSGKIRFLIAAVLTAILSIAAYEIFAPLLLGFALGLAFAKWRSSPKRREIAPRAARNSAIVVAALVLVGALYKMLSTERTGSIVDPSRYLRGLRQFFRVDYDWRVDSSLNAFVTPEIELWAPVRGWLSGAIDLVEGRSGLLVAVIALVISAIAWWRLAARDQSGAPPTYRLLLVLGLGTFLVAHTIFLVVPLSFSSTGIDNRFQVAAAIGTAMLFAELIVLLTTIFAPHHRRFLLAGIAAAATAAGFTRLSAIEKYWAEAPALQQSVLENARIDLQAVPANSTVIIDGVCPYHGPAVIFEADWGVSGVLSLEMRRPLNGDVVSRRMSAGPTGLETSIYKKPRRYPYSEDLYMYDPARHLLSRLPDRQAAIHYFASRESVKCPVGFVARGVEI